MLPALWIQVQVKLSSKISSIRKSKEKSLGVMFHALEMCQDHSIWIEMMLYVHPLIDVGHMFPLL